LKSINYCTFLVHSQIFKDREDHQITHSDLYIGLEVHTVHKPLIKYNGVHFSIYFSKIFCLDFKTKKSEEFATFFVNLFQTVRHCYQLKKSLLLTGSYRY